MRLIFTVIVAFIFTANNTLFSNTCSGQEDHLSVTAISSIQPQDVKPFAARGVVLLRLLHLRPRKTCSRDGGLTENDLCFPENVIVNFPKI